MKRCSAEPYEGSEKYIFLSYCHKDKGHVYPIIEQMVKDGYRVWYDEGIDPGSEWPEVIAQHLNDSAVFIGLISTNSIESHNCRREINFAVQKGKKFLTVFIEEVQMTPGMEMLLMSNQAMFKYKFDNDREFFGKLYDVDGLLACKGSANPNQKVSSFEDYLENEDNKKSRPSFSDEWFLNSKENIISEEITEAKAVLTRITTNDQFIIKVGRNSIGRSQDLCDFVVYNNGTVSKVHAYIDKKDDKYILIDNNSSNKTFLNSEELEPEKEYELNSGDIIRLSNERFEFIIEN